MEKRLQFIQEFNKGMDAIKPFIITNSEQTSTAYQAGYASAKADAYKLVVELMDKIYGN